MKTQRELDQESLRKAKTYEARVQMLRVLGKGYGVKIYPAASGRNLKDQLKSKMVRECPHHGKIEVNLFAFVARGNFACHLCINDGQRAS